MYVTLRGEEVERGQPEVIEGSNGPTVPAIGGNVVCGHGSPGLGAGPQLLDFQATIFGLSQEVRRLGQHRLSRRQNAPILRWVADPEKEIVTGTRLAWILLGVGYPLFPLTWVTLVAMRKTLHRKGSEADEDDED